MTSVLIGHCHNGSVREEFHGCLIDLLTHEAQRKALSSLQRTRAGGPYIAANRNRIVRFMLEKTTAEWLLFLDSDMVFNADLLERLLDVAYTSGHVILAGCYITLGNGKTPVIAWLVRGKDDRLQTAGEVDPAKIVPLAAAGTGCMLIHRKVFEAIAVQRRPHPGGFGPEGGDDWIWFGHDLDHGERMGEDVTFCLRAASAGFTTYGVGSVQLGHMKTSQLGLDALKDKAPPKSALSFFSAFTT